MRRHRLTRRGKFEPVICFAQSPRVNRRAALRGLDKMAGDQFCLEITEKRFHFGENPESVQLAYALQGYLTEDRAYTCQSPPICPKCSSPVDNVTARFCGR